MQGDALRAYWWNPRREGRSMLGESLKAGAAWAAVVGGGGGLFRNFGDTYSSDFLSYATGRSIVWGDLRHASVVCVGSLLERVISSGANVTVLGTGFRSVPSRLASFEQLRVVGVRGLLSCGILGLSSSYAVGDPGLACRRVYSLSSMNRVDGRIGVVPHFRMLGGTSWRCVPWFLEMNNDVAVINPGLPPRLVAERIAGCSLVVSASLHGLIFADSLGVPAVAWRGALENGESEFKYSDYSSILDQGVVWAGSSTLCSVDGLRRSSDEASFRRDRIWARVRAFEERVLEEGGSISGGF